MNRRTLLGGIGITSAMLLIRGSSAQAVQLYGAISEDTLKKPGVVSINVELNNGPADKNHDGLKRNLELALAHGVQKGASYEIKAVPGTGGLDFNNWNVTQVEWYAKAGDIVRDAGFIPVLLTFIGPAEKGVLPTNYASSIDIESAGGLEATLKFLQLGGAAKAESVIGPGTVDQHFQKDTGHLYDRWDRNLTTKILPAAQKYRVILAPESLRREESGALVDVLKFGDYVRKINSPHFKMQLDTAHLRATYGRDYLTILEQAIKDDLVAHLHVSEWGPWNSPGNRGFIDEDTPVGKDMKELFSMLRRVGYRGTIGIEIPHYLFGGAVGRKIKGLDRYTKPDADPTNVLGKFAEDEQQESVRYIMTQYHATRNVRRR